MLDIEAVAVEVEPPAAPKADPRLWETTVLFDLRDAFRAVDVWLARSRRYGDIWRTVLTIPAVPDADRSRSRLVRATGSPSASSSWPMVCAGWPPKARAGASTAASIEDRILRVD